MFIIKFKKKYEVMKRASKERKISMKETKNEKYKD